MNKIIYNYLEICMVEENRSQEFRLKDIDKVRNYLIEGINENDFISKNQNFNKLSINYFGYSIILVSPTFSLILIFAFVSLVGILLGIVSSAVGLKK